MNCASCIQQGLAPAHIRKFLSKTTGVTESGAPGLSWQYFIAFQAYEIICLTICPQLKQGGDNMICPFRVKGKLQYANKHIAVWKNYNFPYVGIIQIR